MLDAFLYLLGTAMMAGSIYVAASIWIFLSELPFIATEDD